MNYQLRNKIKKNVELKPLCYYKVGGKAKFFIDAKNKDDIIEGLNFAMKKGLPFFILGEGSNVLFSDDGFQGVVIRYLKNPKSKIQNPKLNRNSMILIDKNLVEVEASVILDDLIQFCFDNDLIGLEWAGGCPGNFGAAIRGNVGAFGREIKESIVEVEVIEIQNSLPDFSKNQASQSEFSLKNSDRKFKIQKYKYDDLKFEYRGSIIKYNKNMVVIGGKIKLKEASNKELELAKKEYRDHIEYRRSRHPLEYANCGSVFKNIEGKERVRKVLEKFPEAEKLSKEKWRGKVPMGFILEKLGLKGMKLGKAQISPKHGNFIVNLGGAKAKDIIDSINIVKDRFYKEFGFEAEEEIEIV